MTFNENQLCKNTLIISLMYKYNIYKTLRKYVNNFIMCARHYENQLCKNTLIISLCVQDIMKISYVKIR